MKASLVIQSLQAKALELDALYEKVVKQRNALYEVIRLYEQNSDNTDMNAAPTHGEEITSTIEQLLIAEQPLHRSVILERVQSKDIYIGGNSPMNAISSYLSLDPRFKPVGRGMWALVTQPDTVLSEMMDDDTRPMLDGWNSTRIAQGNDDMKIRENKIA